MVRQDDRSVNDRAFTKHARLMKGGAAGEIIGCRRAQCTHVITVASRVTYSHTRVDSPSHCSTMAAPRTVPLLHCYVVHAFLTLTVICPLRGVHAGGTDVAL